MKKKFIRRALFCFLTFISFVALFLLLAFPGQTVNRVFSAFSNIEFRLLAKVSCWFPKEPDLEGPHLTLGSHRGVVEERGVENSHQSIEEALEKRFRCLEVDISFSSDFEPYLFHGPGLELVGLKGRFSDYSSQMIKKFRLKNGQPIIPLSDFCRLYGSRFERIYLDIKGDNTHHRVKARMLCQAISNYALEHFVLIGLPWRVIREVKKALPSVGAGFEGKGAIANYLLGADTISLYYKGEFSFAEYKLARFMGLNVLIWTVNDFKLLKDISKRYRLVVLTDLKNPEELSKAGILCH